MSKLFCIYHGGCNDGFGSAFIVHMVHHGEVDFHFGVYGEDPPDCTDREVLLVDFSYKENVMRRIAEQARKVLVLDHHKSAEKELQPLIDEGLIECVFDMSKSGVGLTWDWFANSFHKKAFQPMINDLPWLFAYIQDRDLWKKELPHCDAVHAALSSYEQDFYTWSAITGRDGPEQLIEEGKAIQRYRRKTIDRLKETAIMLVIGGYQVPAVNCSLEFYSEVAGELAEYYAFAACFTVHNHGVTFSLRSRGDDAVDVSQIAAAYGGGGHAKAAGFRLNSTFIVDSFEDAGLKPLSAMSWAASISLRRAARSPTTSA